MGDSQEEFEHGARAAAGVAADPVFSALHDSGAPIIVASGNPLRIDFLNDTARDLFGDDPDALGDRLFRDDQPGARRLAEIVDELRGGEGLRLERLRLSFARVTQTVTLLCRGVEANGGVSILIAALGLHAASPSDEPPAAAPGDETVALRRSASEPPAAAPHSEGGVPGSSADNVVTLRAPSFGRGAADSLETLSSSERLAFDEIARTLKAGGVVALDAAAADDSLQQAQEPQQAAAEQHSRDSHLRGPEQSALAFARSPEENLARAKSENALLGAVFDLTPTPLAITAADGTILRANAEFAACLGGAAHGAENRNLASFLNPADAANLAQRLSLVLSEGNARLSLSQAPLGVGAPVDLALRRLPVEENPTILVTIEAVQIGALNERAFEAARRAAESADAAKSDFLARVSHEIRTPLNAIIGFAEAMMEERLGPLGSPRYKEYLKDMHVSGAHVLSLVNDLLDLSKIEAGKMELSFSRVDVNAAIAECASIMLAQANQARVVLRLALAPSLPPLSADPRSLKQILLNLLSNAVKFNEPGGQVIVSSALTDAGAVVIRVKDTGIGMSEEDVATALEPFRQVGASRKASGTGLGLPLTKALIEANHASFSIKSRPNEGTLVEITFPSQHDLAAE